MYADDSIYQGINPVCKTPTIYGYAFTVRQGSEPTIFLMKLYTLSKIKTIHEQCNITYNMEILPQDKLLLIKQY